MATQGRRRVGNQGHSLGRQGGPESRRVSVTFVLVQLSPQDPGPKIKKVFPQMTAMVVRPQTEAWPTWFGGRVIPVS